MPHSLRRLGHALFGMLAVCAVARAALAEECRQAVSGENAHQVFDALRRANVDDDCTLETVRTETSRITVVLKKGDTLQEGILVAPTACVIVATTQGAVLSTVVPPLTAEACPATTRALATIVAQDNFGGLVVVSEPSVMPDALRRRWPRRIPGLSIGALAAALAAAALLATSRRRSTGKWSRPRTVSGAGLLVTSTVMAIAAQRGPALATTAPTSHPSFSANSDGRSVASSGVQPHANQGHPYPLGSDNESIRLRATWRAQRLVAEAPGSPARSRRILGWYRAG